jgi:hypothetical protein
LNQNNADLGIPVRFKLIAERSRRATRASTRHWQFNPGCRKELHEMTLSQRPDSVDPPPDNCGGKLGCRDYLKGQESARRRDAAPRLKPALPSRDAPQRKQWGSRLPKHASHNPTATLSAWSPEA